MLDDDFPVFHYGPGNDLPVHEIESAEPRQQLGGVPSSIKEPLVKEPLLEEYQWLRAFDRTLHAPRHQEQPGGIEENLRPAATQELKVDLGPGQPVILHEQVHQRETTGECDRAVQNLPVCPACYGIITLWAPVHLPTVFYGNGGT